MASYKDIEQQAIDKSKQTSSGYANTANGVSDTVKQQIQAAVDKANANANNYANTARSQTDTAYGKIVDTNAVNNAILRQSVKNALKKIGVNDSELNDTQDVAMNISLGNANYNAKQQQKRANDALANQLASYMIQSDTNRNSYNANVNNSTANNILNEQSKGWQNAMTNAAGRYDSATQAEDASTKQQQEAQQQLDKVNQEINRINSQASIYNQQMQDKANEAAMNSSLANAKNQYDEVAKLITGNGTTPGISIEDALRIAQGKNTDIQQAQQDKANSATSADFHRLENEVDTSNLSKPKGMDWNTYLTTNEGRYASRAQAVVKIIDDIDHENFAPGTEQQLDNYIDNKLTDIQKNGIDKYKLYNDYDVAAVKNDVKEELKKISAEKSNNTQFKIPEKSQLRFTP